MLVFYFQETCLYAHTWSETSKTYMGVLYFILTSISIVLCPSKAQMGSFNGIFGCISFLAIFIRYLIIILLTNYFHIKWQIQQLIEAIEQLVIKLKPLPVSWKFTAEKMCCFTEWFAVLSCGKSNSPVLQNLGTSMISAAS